MGIAILPSVASLLTGVVILGLLFALEMKGRRPNLLFISVAAAFCCAPAGMLLGSMVGDEYAGALGLTPQAGAIAGLLFGGLMAFLFILTISIDDLDLDSDGSSAA